MRRRTNTRTHYGTRTATLAAVVTMVAACGTRDRGPSAQAATAAGSTQAPVAPRAAESPSATARDTATLTVYKTPTCGCCANWVEHMQANGFRVVVHDVVDVAPVRAEHGVPAVVSSCHTALVDGYVVEGHVPADDVRRLLRERPAVLGLAVPGMPNGSPGMEGPNPPDRYTVLAFDRASGHPFARH